MMVEVAFPMQHLHNPYSNAGEPRNQPLAHRIIVIMNVENAYALGVSNEVDCGILLSAL